MKKIINNITISIKEQENNILLSAFSSEDNYLNTIIPMKQSKNKFLIKKIKGFEILNLLSSNFNKLDKKSEIIEIKFFQINYNLEKIIKQTFKYKEDFIMLINTDSIKDIIKEIQMNYSEKDSAIYLNDKSYENLIKTLILRIKNLISFLIDNNKYVEKLKEEIFIIKNFKTYAIFTNPNKKLNNNILKRQTIFFTYKNEKFENILPYKYIYSLPKNKKLITYNYDKDRKLYVVYYTYNTKQEDKIFLKKYKNDKFYNLNKLFENNIDFNIKNTKFKQIANLYVDRIYIEKMLFELIEEDSNEEQEEQEENKIEVKVGNEELDENTDNKSEEIISQIIEESDSIFIYQEEFEKEIEDKLFF